MGKNHSFNRDYELRPYPGGVVACCAHCGGNNTHQETVTIFDWGEGATSGVLVSYGPHPGELTTRYDDRLANNPSSRRQGLTIQLACETCEKVTFLDVYQHKGETLIAVRADD